MTISLGNRKCRKAQLGEKWDRATDVKKVKKYLKHISISNDVLLRNVYIADAD